jgi:hypothetical protein
MTNAFTPSLLAAATLTLAASALAAPVTEQRTVGAFSAVDVSGPYKVIVRAQGQQSVSLSGEAKDLAEIETVLRGNTLVVRPRHREKFWINIGAKRERATITISANAIDKVRTGATGETHVEQVSGERFELVGEGPGDVHASGSVKNLVAAARGPGDLHLRQLSAASVDLSADGPGDVSLGKIAGGDVSVNVNGPGDVDANSLSAGKISARLRGPGDLRLAGAARELHMEVDGPGDFHGCSLSTQAAQVLMRGPGDACISGAIARFEAESHGPGDLKVNGLQAQAVKVQVHGPGSIELNGTVETLNAQVHGPGKLDGKGLTAGRAEVAVHGPGNARVNLKDANGTRLATFNRSMFR